MYSCSECNEIEKKLMKHCFYDYWMFYVQMGLSLNFIKMILNVWYMMFVSTDLEILL